MFFERQHGCFPTSFYGLKVSGGGKKELSGKCSCSMLARHQEFINEGCARGGKQTHMWVTRNIKHYGCSERRLHIWGHDRILPGDTESRWASWGRWWPNGLKTELWDVARETDGQRQGEVIPVGGTGGASKDTGAWNSRVSLEKWNRMVQLEGHIKRVVVALR